MNPPTKFSEFRQLHTRHRVAPAGYSNHNRQHEFEINIADRLDTMQLRVNFERADELGAKVVHLRGKVPGQLINYAREQNVTHIVLGHPPRGRWDEVRHDSVTGEILCQVPGVDVYVVGERD
jgi:K+-sensing histidine kinase KdpD